MEQAASKPYKTSSNIGDIVSKFAKACKLRSVGVLSSENLENLHPSLSSTVGSGEDSNEATESAAVEGEKIDPRPVKATGMSNGGSADELMKLFDIISSLKLAYVRLQEAHIPYRPEEIVAADELVVKQIETLCKIKRAYKQKQFAKINQYDSQSDLLRAKIKASESLLEELKSKSRSKNSEILCLIQQLQDLELKNKKLLDETKQMHLERRKLKILSTTFQDAYRATCESIHQFAKPLITLMKASGWDLDMAAESVVDSVAYSKRSDRKYVFEAYIARRMFHGMAFKSCNIDDVMRFSDPIACLIENPNSAFAKFCCKKYLLVVHDTLEESFFGNLDHRKLLLSGKHPRTPFYQLFAKMAKCIWILRSLSASVDPNAKLFAVKRGSKFSADYMQSVKEDMKLPEEEESGPTVEFMVMPGFKVGETLLRSRVYLSKVKSRDGSSGAM